MKMVYFDAKHCKGMMFNFYTFTDSPYALMDMCDNLLFITNDFTASLFGTFWCTFKMNAMLLV